jgi:hypothetical protein
VHCFICAERLHSSYIVAARAAGTADQIRAIIGPQRGSVQKDFAQSRRGTHISLRHYICDIVHFAPAFFE